MSAVGGQNLRVTGRGLQVELYPADLRTLVANAISALGALHDGIESMDPHLDAIQLGYLAADVDRLYHPLDHIGARVGNAQAERLASEHSAIAHVARALMAPADPA